MLPRIDSSSVRASPWQLNHHRLIKAVSPQRACSLNNQVETAIRAIMLLTNASQHWQIITRPIKVRTTQQLKVLHRKRKTARQHSSRQLAHPVTTLRTSRTISSSPRCPRVEVEVLPTSRVIPALAETNSSKST